MNFARHRCILRTTGQRRGIIRRTTCHPWNQAPRPPFSFANFASLTPPAERRTKTTWFVLRAFVSRDVRSNFFLIFQVDCEVREPPGQRIYRRGWLSVYEVDGAGPRFYCDCLCLFGKLFLDQKAVIFCADAFLFYVACKSTPQGQEAVGFFSKV